MNNTIQEFLHHQKAASVCCTDVDGHPYCFSCFYAFDAEEGLLYFKTGASSHHTPLMKLHPDLAGTILPNQLELLGIKGVQWEGVLLPTDHPLTKNASVFYHKKYPFARAKPGDVYTVQINHIKMTDSSRIFATKTHWQRGEQPEGV